MMEKSPITWEEIMKFRSEEPFRPFFIELKSGKILEVLEALWYGGNEVAGSLGVCHPTMGIGLYKASDVVGLRLMTDEEIAARSHLRDQRRRA